MEDDALMRRQGFEEVPQIQIALETYQCDLWARLARSVVDTINFGIVTYGPLC